MSILTHSVVPAAALPDPWQVQLAMLTYKAPPITYEARRVDRNSTGYLSHKEKAQAAAEAEHIRYKMAIEAALLSYGFRGATNLEIKTKTKFGKEVVRRTLWELTDEGTALMRKSSSNGHIFVHASAKRSDR